MKGTQQPAYRPTPAEPASPLRESTIATEPATVENCAEDYAGGSAARDRFDKHAQRFPNHA